MDMIKWQIQDLKKGGAGRFGDLPLGLCSLANFGDF